jgi:hypothetical protein
MSRLVRVAIAIGSITQFTPAKRAILLNENIDATQTPDHELVPAVLPLVIGAERFGYVSTLF